MPYFLIRISFTLNKKSLKHCLILFHLIFLLAINIAEAQKSKLEPFFDETSYLYGYRTGDGKVKITPEYADASPFFNGYARVTIDDKQGIINQKGKIIIPVIYEEVGWSGDKNNNVLFKNGLIGIKLNGIWGVINEKSETILSPRFDYLEPFHKGLAVIGKWTDADKVEYGVVKSDGNFLLLPEYETLEIDNEAEVIIAKKYIEGELQAGAISTNGIEVLPFVYREIEQLSNGEFKIADFNGKWGLYNDELHKIYPHTLDSIGEIQNKRVIVKAENRYAAINAKGEALTPFKYKKLALQDTALQGETFSEFQLITREKELKGKFYYDSVVNVGNDLFAAYASGKRSLLSDNAKQIWFEQYDRVRPFTDNLVLVEEYGQVGVIDQTGKFLIPVQFRSIKVDGNNRLIVTKIDFTHDIYDKSGKNLTNGKYKHINPFQSNRYRVEMFDNSVAFLNSDLQIVSEGWQNGGNYTDGYAAVKTNDLYGVIDLESNWVISPYIDSLIVVNKNYFIFYDNKEWGTVNTNGVELYKSDASIYSFYPQGTLLVKYDGNQGLINTYGSEVLSPIYKSVSTPTSDSLVYVSKGRNQFYMDLRSMQEPEGTEMLNLEYDKNHSAGYFRAKVYGLYGFVDYLGRIRVYCQYEDVHYYSEGLAGFKLGGKWGYFNKRGQIIIQPAFEAITGFNNGYAIVKKGGKWGLINKDIKPIIPFEYDSIEETKYGNYIVKQGNKTGIYRSKDFLSIYPKFDEVNDCGNGAAIVKINGRYGVSQLDGITIAYPEYDRVKYNPFDNSFFLIQNGSDGKKIE